MLHSLLTSFHNSYAWWHSSSKTADLQARRPSLLASKINPTAWDLESCIHHPKLHLHQSLCSGRGSYSSTCQENYLVPCHHHTWDYIHWNKFSWAPLLCTSCTSCCTCWLYSWPGSYIGLSQALVNRCLTLPNKGQLQIRLQAPWIKGCSSLLLENDEAFIGPHPKVRLPLLHPYWQAPSEGFQVFHNDHGPCPQKLPKQNPESAAQSRK